MADARYARYINKDRDTILAGDNINYGRYRRYSILGCENAHAIPMTIGLAYRGGSLAIIELERMFTVGCKRDDIIDKGGKPDRIEKTLAKMYNDIFVTEIMYIIETANIKRLLHIMSIGPQLVMQEMLNNLECASKICQSGSLPFARAVFNEVGMLHTKMIVFGAYKSGSLSMIDWIWTILGEDKKQKYANICIHGACEGGQWALYKSLIDSLDKPMSAGEAFHTLHHFAYMGGNMSIIRSLLTDDVIYRYTSVSNVYSACMSGKVDVYELAMEIFGRHTNNSILLATSFRRTCLEFSIQAYGKFGRSELIFKLINDIKVAKNKIGIAKLVDMCNEYGLEDVIEELTKISSGRRK